MVKSDLTSVILRDRLLISGVYARQERLLLDIVKGGEKCI